jgi:hypothetical protein
MYNVSGSIMLTSSFCGGARPNEEMMMEAERPKPYVGKTLYVRRGMSNSAKEKIILKFTANKAGEFNFRLPAGTYVIIQAEQVNAYDSTKVERRQYINVDHACMREWWVKPLYVLEVIDKDVKGLVFPFHRRCFISSDVPCFNYSGPMPQ